jgi:serine/threonine protein kinase
MTLANDHNSMTSERYQQIGRLFDEALEHAPERRASWLKEACGADAELRAEVEKLLAYHNDSEEYLARPALDVAAAQLAQNQELSMLGQMISHYRVISLLGAGGMGKVYLAEDTKLRRKIALKVLPDSLAQDKERVRRFEQEAFAASALNHPNILTIFEFGAEGEVHYLASELVQGETLRSRMQRDAISLFETLDITIQITSALQAAHAANIIHRDIKPENVMVRNDGIVKVLDFGLAKLIEPTSSDPDDRARMQALTQAGTIMGTVDYMSPEQARGIAVDARSDLFSLGVMLYEMLSGRRPFTGETSNHTIVAILEREPPQLTVTGKRFPVEIEKIVNQVLAKKTEERYQSATALLADMKKLKHRLEFEAELATGSIDATAIAKQTKIPRVETRESIAAESSPNVTPLESVNIAHVLFCDVVGYSLLPIDRQTQLMRTLQHIVRNTEEYRRSNESGQLVRLPAGDGMALAFLQDVAAPVRLACELVRALRAHPDIKMRIGIHSGPVFLSADINAIRNVVGSGINMAQRVMDCGDAGHILISSNVADVLEQISHWRPLLHDLGEHKVKHGVRIHLFNLYSDEVGNPALPAKFQTERQQEKNVAVAPNPLESPLDPGRAADDVSHTHASAPANRKLIWLVCVLIAAGVISILAWRVLRSRSVSPPTQSAAALPERNLSYFLTVQKYRDGKPYQSEFQSSGREIFEPGWHFKLNMTSPQEGFLYVLNEQPAPAGSQFALLFPLPSYKNGSAHLLVNERLQTSWYVFDDTPGTEQFRLVWAAQPVPELEAIRGLVNPTDQGRISNPAQTQAIRALLQRHAQSQVASAKDAQNKQTNVRGQGATLVVLVELEHH